MTYKPINCDNDHVSFQTDGRLDALIDAKCPRAAYWKDKIDSEVN
uniref:Uncharacterized protein n=1 Tax=Arundo donax TaxID=35708 RepID=A0A0A9BZ42_ARUDO